LSSLSGKFEGFRLSPGLNYSLKRDDRVVTKFMAGEEPHHNMKFSDALKKSQDQIEGAGLNREV
jgi:hypothetical protein